MRHSMAAVTILSAMLAGAGSSAMVSVDILDSSFQPESLFVAPGDTVVWTHNGVFPHTTTSGINGNPDGIWDSGTLANGQSFSYVFAEEGDFPYYCTFHYLGGMKGNVTVTTSGVEEQAKSIGFRRGVSVVAGSFYLQGSGPAILVDANGRAAARLRAGNNDLGALAPGLYFLLPLDPEVAPARLILAR